MKNPWTYLFHVLAIPLAFACLGMPSRAVAQQPNSHCLKCEESDDYPDYLECDSHDNRLGYLACKLTMGGKQCATSTGPDGGPNCKVVVTLAGRVSPDVDPEPWLQALGVTELPRRAQQEGPTVDDPLEVTRHGCTGAIIQRRYSSARIEELRSGLRRVTV